MAEEGTTQLTILDVLCAVGGNIESAADVLRDSVSWSCKHQVFKGRVSAMRTPSSESETFVVMWVVSSAPVVSG